MTVHELIKHLEMQPLDATVWIHYETFGGQSGAKPIDCVELLEDGVVKLA